jgi:hypothetical protein
MSGLMRLAWMILGPLLKRRAIKHAKRRGVMAYLQVLQTGRRVTLSALAAFVILQCMILAGFGALVTGVLLLELDPRNKLQILFGIFAGGFLLPALALAVLLSERTWYKASGAKKMVEDLLKKGAA